MGIEIPDLPPPPEENFQVWEINWDTVQMFLRLQTQWRTNMGGLTGLDYTAAEWLFKLYSVEQPRELLEGLQVMEAAPMSKLNKSS